MKKLRHITAWILSIFVTVIAVSSVFAGQSDEVPMRDCVHSWEIRNLYTIPIPNDNYTHILYTARDRVCKKCGEIETLDPILDPVSHTLNYSYTGNNYHSGNRHYFEYTPYCTVCGFINPNNIWRSGYCSGGTHISPLTITPITNETE